jgi:hypothetical protein
VTSTRALIAAAAVLGLIGALAILRFTGDQRKEAPAAPSPAPQRQIVVTKPATTIHRDQERQYTAALEANSFSTPERAVDSALKMLQLGDEAGFRTTFLPAVQGQITPEVFATCRAFVQRTKVMPDWETSESSTQAGRAVKRVSMFGKSLTGFHEIDGRWYADRVWCLPTGVP